MTLAEIKSAIWDLAPNELTELTAFVAELDNAAWDEQMDEDATSGRFDRFFEEADPTRKSGGVRDHPTDR